MFNGLNNKSLNVPTVTGLSNIYSDSVITTNSIVEDTLIVNGVDISTEIGQIDVNKNNIQNLQQITTGISYDLPTDTTTIDNNIKTGGDLDMNTYDILNIDVIKGSSNTHCHFRALGTGHMHFETNGANDRMTIDDNGTVKIFSNNLNMNFNDIINCNNLQTNYINGSVLNLSLYAQLAANNIFTGTNTFKRLESSLTNIVYGSSTTMNESLGTDNIIVGKSAFNATTVSSSLNTIVGSEAGLNITGTTGGHTALGYRAMRGNTGANPSGSNTAIGNQSLVSVTTGNLNTGVGTLSLGSITTGVRNTAIGHSAGRYSTTSNNNVSIGYNSGGTTNRAASNVTLVGADITFSGSFSNSSAFGYGVSITEANKIFLGRSTEITYPVGGLKLPTAGTTIDMTLNDIINCNNIQTNTINGVTVPTLTNIAYTNLSNTFTQTNDFQRIHQSLPNSNFVFGTSTTLPSVTTGNNNICIGSGAGQTITTGIQNILIGTNAGNLYNNQNMIAIGFGALDLCTASAGSQAIGTGCLGSLTTGSSNTGNGNNALRDVVSGLRNTAMGQAALRDVVGSASDNCAFGANAGLNVVNATNNNTFIGSQTGFNSTGDTYNNSTALGYNSKITASNIIFLGTASEITIPVGGLKMNTASTVLDMNGNNITNAKQIISNNNDIDIVVTGTNYITFNTNNTLRGYITNAGLFKILTNTECDNNTKTGSLSVTNNMDISGNIILSTTNYPSSPNMLGYTVSSVTSPTTKNLTSNTIVSLHNFTVGVGVYLVHYNIRITQTSGSRQNSERWEKGISTANNTFITTAGDELYSSYAKYTNTTSEYIGLASGEDAIYSFMDKVLSVGGTYYINVRVTFTGSNWTAQIRQIDYIRIA